MKPCWLALSVLSAWPLLAAESNSVLIRNVTVHPVTAQPIAHGAVLVVDGKIAEVGTRVGSKSGVRVVDGHGLHLYPGMINAGTNVGLSEVSALRDTVDVDEIGPFNPELRAEVAFNPSSEHIEVTRASGITSLVSLPGEARSIRNSAESGIITGQGAVMHLNGWTWEEMAVKRSAVMDMFFPTVQQLNRYGVFFGAPNRGFTEEEKRYRDTLQNVSEFFEQARRYAKAKAAGSPDFRRNLRLEAMIPVVEGKVPILVRAERERMIQDAVRFADQEKVRIIIADPREMGSTGPLLKSHNIPVVLGKTFQLPMRDDDAYDAPYTLPSQFQQAGVKVCFATFDVEFARNLPFEAAQAAAFGMPKEEALKGVTINSAEILGVGDRLGSIQKGKLADLILTDGDPLETRTNIKGMYIAGQQVSLESRHTREYERWSKRP